MRDLNRVTQNLITLGQEPLLKTLLSGPLPERLDIPFSSLAAARSIMAKLYDFLWFHPGIKERVSLRLNLETATLSITPKVKRERRGRRKII